ncbi:MAG: hypothetical protein EOO44_14645 [Flavobacterium sp.]|nr:MAG: hypothetical protein EOO44_14645 [Flavobacterium sp.]
METKEKSNRTSENRSLNLNKQNAIMSESLYNNGEIKRGHQNFGDVRDYGHTVSNGYDPNKAIPNKLSEEDDFDEVDDLDDDFHAPGDLDHEGDELLNDDFDNPRDMNDDFNETEDDLEDIDDDDNDDFNDNGFEDDEDLEDDLEKNEIEEEEPGENYPDNDPRKF